VLACGGCAAAHSQLDRVVDSCGQRQILYLQLVLLLVCGGLWLLRVLRLRVQRLVTVLSQF
jgi:hypothetical protein